EIKLGLGSVIMMRFQIYTKCCNLEKLLCRCGGVPYLQKVFFDAGITIGYQLKVEDFAILR
ncbi:MAG: hypothetical protein ACOYME_06555, partial [Prochlorotrichaceae cyanobacterium]